MSKKKWQLKELHTQPDAEKYVKGLTLSGALDNAIGLPRSILSDIEADPKIIMHSNDFNTIQQSAAAVLVHKAYAEQELNEARIAAGLEMRDGILFAGATADLDGMAFQQYQRAYSACKHVLDMMRHYLKMQLLLFEEDIARGISQKQFVSAGGQVRARRYEEQSTEYVNMFEEVRKQHASWSKTALAKEAASRLRSIGTTVSFKTILNHVLAKEKQDKCTALSTRMAIQWKH